MGKDLETRVVEALMGKGWHVSCAESCTGGLLSGRLVNVPNASHVLDLGFVTYANEAKVRYLGVREETIEEYGVVSEPVAAQMAEGTARAAGAQAGLSTSGIAGPGGAVPGKPVGTVCFGISLPGRTLAWTDHFEGMERNKVREAAVTAILERFLALLEEEA